MYCFYVNREWKDVNETDYNIIADADIENSIYSEEEKAFLKQKKEQLLQEYKKHL